MKILITGGLGYIGSNLAASLIENHNVTIVSHHDNLPDILKKYTHNLVIIIDDYSSDKILNEIIPQQDIIIHAAGTTVPENSTKNPISDIEENVIKSIKLIEAAAKSEIKKFIFLSSGGVVYGNTSITAINEENITNPVSSYGITKLMVEKYLNMYHHLYNLNFVSLRISNAYGPKQSFKNNQGVISNWINKAKLNEPIEIWGNEKITRDYIFIEDIVQALLKALENKLHGEYNIGTGKGTSLIDLARLIIKLTHSQSEIKINSSVKRKFDIIHNVLDSAKFQKTTGWCPKINIEDGIKRCL